MKLCTETITVFNKRINSDTGSYIYYPTVISNISWYSDIQTSIDDVGIHGANKFIVRIPLDADFGEKSYADPIAYRDAESVSNIFTLAQGDVVVKAAITQIMSLAQIQDNYTEHFTILGVTDNRRAPNAPHWRVIGK